MTDRFRRAIGIFAFILLCSAGTIMSAWRVRDWHDGLSPVDAYSEANALREVDGFRAQGIGHDAGLGNVLYGSRYPEAGFAASAQDRACCLSPNGVYTHYPPGPEYLLYATEGLLGQHPVSRLRALPLLVGWIAAICLGFSLRRRFGAPVAWLVMLTCLAVVPFSDANSYLHYLGYALALVLIEIAVSIGRNRYVAIYSLLGFLQGWLSFDHFFLITLIPVAIALAAPHLQPGEPTNVQLAFYRSSAAAAGFIVAHSLHFLQVCAYYGSLQAAVTDLHRSAQFRAGATGGITDYLIRSILVLKFYLISPQPIIDKLGYPGLHSDRSVYAFRFIGVTLGVWWAVTTLILTAISIRQRKIRQTPSNLTLSWCSISSLGIIVSSAWWFVMQNHAINHPHILYRQLFFCFFLCVLFLSVRIVNAAIAAGWLPDSAGPPHPAPPPIR